MTDRHYNELLEMFGKERADAARKAVNTGNIKDLKDYMDLRRSLHNENSNLHRR